MKMLGCPNRTENKGYVIINCPYVCFDSCELVTFSYFYLLKCMIDANPRHFWKYNCYASSDNLSFKQESS